MLRPAELGHVRQVSAIPAAAKVKSYALIERYGLIWIWMGDQPAEETRLPADFAFMADAKFRAVSGYLRVEGNYQLIVDNLLDLTHAPYLHPAFAIPGISAEERLKRTTTELVREPERVIAKRWRLACPPNGPTRNLFGFSEELGLCLSVMNAITPATDRAIYYYIAQGRNMLLDDPHADEELLGILENAFHNEDEPMIAAQQARMGRETDVMALDPVLLKSDSAPVTARRFLAGMIAAEQQR